MNQKLQAIQDAADYREQRQRRVKKVAQRVSAGKGSMKDEKRRRRGTGFAIYCVMSLKKCSMKAGD